MKKRLYSYPVTDVRILNTNELMKAGGTSPSLPDDPGAKTPTTAPARRTEVF